MATQKRGAKMFEDLYWMYMAYNITKHHGPTWGEKEIEYFEIIIRGIDALESNIEAKHGN